MLFSFNSVLLLCLNNKQWKRSRVLPFQIWCWLFFPPVLKITKEPPGFYMLDKYHKPKTSLLSQCSTSHKTQYIIGFSFCQQNQHVLPQEKDAQSWCNLRGSRISVTKIPVSKVVYLNFWSKNTIFFTSLWFLLLRKMYVSWLEWKHGTFHIDISDIIRTRTSCPWGNVNCKTAENSDGLGLTQLAVLIRQQLSFKEKKTWCFHMWLRWKQVLFKVINTSLCKGRKCCLPNYQLNK